MDRALREFRVRGVKTNIPFLENVVNHPQFQSGQVTTSWLADTPELFQFVQRKDRATRLLTYLSDVIVNGNPSVAGKGWPDRMSTPAPATTRPLAVSAVARSGWIRQYGPWGAAAVVVVLLPYVIRTGSAVPVMNQMGIAVIFALSYNM